MFRKHKSPRFLDSVTEFQFANKSVILYIQRQLKNSRVRISRISRAEDIELVAKYNSRSFVEQYQGHLSISAKIFGIDKDGFPERRTHTVVK